MHDFRRIIVDTNVIVSSLALPGTVPGRAVDHALDHGVLLFSEATIAELDEVLSRPKLHRYISTVRRSLLLAQLASTAEFVAIVQLVRECRDQKDDKFLEVALNGRADVIVTGDADLLALHPWRELAILSPADYLQSCE